MNKSIFIFLLTSIIVLNALNAQQPINVTMNYNARFDEIIKQDKEIQINSFDSISKTKTQIPKSALEYNSKRDYSTRFVLYDFCKINYKEKDVLNFLADVFADTTKEDFFSKDLHRLPCNSVKKYASVKNIFIAYYKKNIKLNPNDSSWEERFFDFQVLNNFPNTLELINHYFENINSDKRKLRNGQKLIIRLIEIGEEQKALDLLNFYVQKFIAGEILSNLNLQESLSNKNGGLLLALSENNEISKKATDLLFQYYKASQYGLSVEENQFLEYVDKKRLAQIEKEKFDKYRNSDLSDEDDLDLYVGYISEMLRLSGTEMGKEIWGYIKKNESLLKARYFKQSLHHFLEQILEDTKLTENDKSEIIDYFKKNNKYISDNESETNHRTLTQYLYLIHATHPEITDKEIELYIPKKYIDDFTWKYAWRDAKNYKQLYGSIPSDFNAVKSCHKDLKESLIFGENFPKELNKYQTFKIKIHSTLGLNTENYLRYIFQDSDKILFFETDEGYGPLDFEMLFNQEFSPLLQEEGIFNLQVIQDVIGDNEDRNNKVQIITEKGIEELQYPSDSNWYTSSAFTKALNLSLMKLNTKLRFLRIETRDEGATYGLFEPNQIVPFAKKYNIQIGALVPQDIFNDL